MSNFYNIDELSLPEKILLLEKAKELSFRWWVDHLGNNSFTRKEVKMEWPDIMKKFNRSAHFSVIQRQFPDYLTNKMYGEVGFVSSDDHYLWILVEVEKFNELVKALPLK